MRRRTLRKPLASFVLSLLLLLSTGVSTLLAQADRKAAADPQRPRAFRAGAATSNITPPLGEPIVGGVRHAVPRTSTTSCTPAAWSSTTGRPAWPLPSATTWASPARSSTPPRRMVHEETGLPEDNLLMAATHTHSATSARCENALMPDPEAVRLSAVPRPPDRRRHPPRRQQPRAGPDRLGRGGRARRRSSTAAGTSSPARPTRTPSAGEDRCG